MYTPLEKELIGNQDKLPENLKKKIEAAPDSPAQMGYDTPAKQAIIDPMTGMPVQQYQPSNTMGNAKPLFSDQTKQIANNMFGQQIPGTFGSALAKKNCNKKY
jgi:hypothetical protein